MKNKKINKQNKNKLTKSKNPSALLLISGGIDSPVAAYLLQKQGIEITAIHFSQTPFTDNSPEKKSIAACKKLKINKLIICEAGKAFQELAVKCYHDHYFVLMKRLMLKVSAEIAKELNINFLATGEALAQVSSQTLENLYTIDQVSNLIVLRPVLCYDKNEIINIAKEIGTYDICTGPEVCDALGPKHPKTKIKLESALEEEKKVNIQELIKEMMKNSEILEIKKIKNNSLKFQCAKNCKNNF